MTQGSIQTAPLPGGFNMAFAGLKTMVLAAEVVAITFLLLGHIDLMAALAIHFGLGGMLIVTIIAAEYARGSAGDLQKFTLQMLVAGPLGSASALIDEQLSTRIKADRLAQWYETIAPAPQLAVTLADRIIDDQVVRPRAKMPKNVERLIMNGSMREKQALFASIVIDGRIEGVNLIEKALRSRDQRVRVQAAAVSAFIRSKLRKSAGISYTPSESPPVAARIAAPARNDNTTPAA